MRESTLERNTCRRLEQIGAQPIKVGFDGWPDRQVLVGANVHFWVEFKQAKGRLRASQVLRIEYLRSIGDTVLVTHTPQEADEACALALSLLSIPLSGGSRASDGRAPAAGGLAQAGSRKNRVDSDSPA